MAPGEVLVEFPPDQAVSAVIGRTERRLAQELAGLRADLARSQARMRMGLRQELQEGLTGVRTEMSATRLELVRWSIVFWAAQLAATAALLGFVLSGR
jgi:hypothetical protein